MFIFI